MVVGFAGVAVAVGTDSVQSTSTFCPPVPLLITACG